MGSYSASTGNYSAAIGYNATAVGGNSLALGYSATTSGSNSIAIGNNANSSGTSSVAIGTDSNAKNNSSFAIGTGLTTGRNTQIVLGRYNAVDTSSQLVFGDGSANNDRRNILTLATNGTLTLLGGLTTGSNVLPSTNNSYDLGSSNAKWRDLNLGRNAAIGGTLSVTGATALGESLTLAGNILPATSLTPSIGNSDYLWNSIYANTLYLKNSGGTGNANACINLWDGNSYRSLINYYNSYIWIGAGVKAANYGMVIGANTISFRTLSGSIGSGTTASMVLTAAGDATNLGSMTPRATAAHDLGTTSLKWRDLYLSRDAVIGGSLTVTGLTTVASLKANTILPNADCTYNLGSASYNWNMIYSDGIEAQSYVRTSLVTASTLQSESQSQYTIDLDDGVVGDGTPMARVNSAVVDVSAALSVPTTEPVNPEQGKVYIVFDDSGSLAV